MASTADLLMDGYGRVREEVRSVLDGMAVDDLCHRAGPSANTIGWLVWHLTRVQDDHLASAAGTEQRWTADGWVDRFDLPFDDAATGYGQSTDEVGALRVEASLLGAYYDAVHAATLRYVGTLTDADLERVVDRRWDPPVTLGVRLVSVLGDDLQHVGQAAYVKGLLDRR